MNTWSARLNAFGSWNVEEEPRGRLVAIVEKAEHANIVAAAPDLLKVLEMAMKALHEAEAILGGEYGDHYGTFCERMLKLEDALNAAIARATGGEA